jgi:hypothetical protein
VPPGKAALLGGGSSDTRERRVARKTATHMGQPVHEVNHAADIGGAFHSTVDLLEPEVGFSVRHVPIDGGHRAIEALLRLEADFRVEGFPALVGPGGPGATTDPVD